MGRFGNSGRVSWLSVLHFLLLSTAVFFLLLPLWNASYYYIYQARDLDRARLLWEGKPIWLGPEINGGGRLPGPFYYWLLAPLWGLTKSWVALWYISQAFAACSFAALALYFGKMRGWIFSGFALLFCFAHPVLPNIQLRFINPSFLWPFAVAALILYLKLWDEAPRSRGRLRTAFLLTLMTALGMQFHLQMSVFLMVLPFILLTWWKAERKIDFRAYGALAAGLLLAFLPFLFAAFFPQHPWVSSAQGLAASSGEWGKVASDFSRTFWRELNTGSESVLGPIIRFLRITHFPALLIFFAFGARLASWGRRTLLLALLASPAVFYYMLLEGRGRYALVFTLAMMVVWGELAVSASKAWSGKKAWTLWSLLLLSEALLHYLEGGLLLSLSLTLLAGPALAFFWLWRAGKNAAGWAMAAGWCVVPFAILAYVAAYSQTVYYPNFNASIEAGHYLREHTSWSHREARERVFFIDAFNQITPRHIWEKILPESRPAIRSEADGYFFFRSIKRLRRLRHVDAENFPEIARQGHFGSVLQKAILGGHLYFGSPIYLKEMTFLPYKLKDADAFPLNYHNLGYSYEVDEASREMQASGVGTGVFPAASGGHWWKWNGCPAGRTYCDVGVRIRRNQRGLEIMIAGEPLSVPSINTIPDWTVTLVKPWVEAECVGNKRVRRLLIDKVGYHLPETFRRQRIATLMHSAVGPLKFHWKQPCGAAVPLRYRAGWEESIITHSLNELRKDGWSGEAMR